MEAEKEYICILGYFKDIPLTSFLNRQFSFDHRKHDGLFSYCQWKNNTLKKNCWYMKKYLKD